MMLVLSRRGGLDILLLMVVLVRGVDNILLVGSSEMDVLPMVVVLVSLLALGRRAGSPSLGRRGGSLSLGFRLATAALLLGGSSCGAVVVGDGRLVS
jgi:hypothetical protein